MVNVPEGDSSHSIVKALFARQVPEIEQGLVDITAVARIPGVRSKVAVRSNDPTIDPIAACVGEQEERIRRIVADLHGERIDVVQWSDSDERRIRRALAPVAVTSVELDPERGRARVTIPQQQPFGIDLINEDTVNLASRLAGRQIEVVFL